METEMKLVDTNSVNWILPSIHELKIEWKTELIESIWFAGYPSKEDQERYKKHFLDNILTFSTVETVEKWEILDQLYTTESIEQLKINIKHMLKDVSCIEKSIHAGTPTMPLFIRKNGTLKIIGGRTRSTVAFMAEKNVIGLIIDRNKMDQVFYPLRRADFIERGFVMSVFESEDVRNNILDYIEGKTLRLPKFKGLFNKKYENDEHIMREITGIKKYLNLT